MAKKVRGIRPHVFLYHIEATKEPTRHPINPGWRAEALYSYDGQELLRSATYPTRESALRDIKYQLQQLGFKGTADVFTMQNLEGVCLSAIARTVKMETSTKQSENQPPPVKLCLTIAQMWRSPRKQRITSYATYEVKACDIASHIQCWMIEANECGDFDNRPLLNMARYHFGGTLSARESKKVLRGLGVKSTSGAVLRFEDGITDDEWDELAKKMPHIVILTEDPRHFDVLVPFPKEAYTAEQHRQACLLMVESLGGMQKLRGLDTSFFNWGAFLDGGRGHPDLGDHGIWGPDFGDQAILEYGPSPR